MPARVATVAPWLRDFTLVGLDMGLRRSNLVGLQWSWLHDHGAVLRVPRQHVKAKKAMVMIDSADSSRGSHSCAPTATQRHAIRVHATERTAVFTRSGGHGIHSHSERGRTFRRDSAYPPAYLHQPAGVGGTAVAGSGSFGGASRHEDDDALCAPGTQPFARGDRCLGTAVYPSPNRTRVIHRTAWHAGVTGIWGNRVSGGGPNGI